MFIALRRTWGEDRVFFLGDDDRQASLPRSWTDAADVDPFVAMAGGRSPLRVDELVVLAEVIDGLRPATNECKGDPADGVRKIPPKAGKPGPQ